MNKLFWNGKKVLITGHTGFKGSWLSLWLQSCGALLTGYSLESDNKLNLFDLASVAEGMNSVIGDIRDLGKLIQTIDDFLPEVVIHMAAQPLVKTSYENPLETYSINVMGTVNLLEAIRKTSSVKVFLNVTSDKCYENKERTLGYGEDERIGGDDPYSNSKGCSELITKAYRNSFFDNSGSVKIASARAGNVIGGGDWAKNRLIPDIVKSIQDERLIKIRHPSAVRPWQHVLEPLSGYLLLIEKLYTHGNEYDGAWNFGPEKSDEEQVKNIVKYFIRNWGYGQSFIEDDSYQPKETQILRLNISKAKKKLGWVPKWNLHKTLDCTIKWYKTLIMNKDIVRSLTLSQISDYENS